MNTILKSSNGINLIPIETRLLSSRKIFLEGEIDSESACNFIRQLMLLIDENKDKPIDVLVNSNGGEVNSGLMIYDVIQSSLTHIRLICVGKAYSMAALIFASGRERYMLPNSRLMLHEPLIQDNVSGSTSSVKSISDSLLETRDKLNKILSKHTNHTIEEIETATNYDHYFSAEESIEFGLCDGIISFSDITEVKQMKFDSMIAGEGCRFSTNSLEPQLNNNVAVIGGSGKSMSYSEPRLLETINSNLIMKVSKRKLIDKYTSLFRSRGYSVKVLDLVNPNKSTVAFDPLYYVKSDVDVTHLAEALVNLDPKKSFKTKADPYWDEAAVDLICAIILFTFAVDDKPTLSNVVKYIKDLKISDSGQSISTNLDGMFKCIERNQPNHLALSYWRSFSQLPTKTARCVYGSLIVAFNSVFTEELMKMMDNDNKLDFEEIAKEETVLFVLKSAVSPSLHSFANLFFSYAIKELFEFAEQQDNGMLPMPLHLLCDDFAVGAQ